MRILKYICIGITLILILRGIFLFHELCNLEIRQSKDYAKIYVDDEFGYELMLEPPEKYRALNQINTIMRKKVADYMKENNLKLKKGTQEFIRTNPTFDELINDGFVFIKCYGELG